MKVARDGAHVAMSASDRSRGGPPEILGRLFLKHVTLTGGNTEGGAAATRLAIWRGLVEMHDGCIRAENEGLGQIRRNFRKRCSTANSRRE